MKSSDLFSWRDDFDSDTGIIDFILNSINFDPKMENARHADALLIFSTSKQHVWLIATSERLYCILDDLRSEKPQFKWSIPKQKLISGRNVSIELRSQKKSGLHGLVDIGDKHVNSLYTKRLFAKDSVENQIRSLIQRKMIKEMNFGAEFLKNLLHEYVRDSGKDSDSTRANSSSLAAAVKEKGNRS